MGGRLKDRVALVIGAGASGPGWGNGKAAAVLFAREGARVFCVDINRAAAEETAGLIAEAGGEAAAYRADVSDGDQVAALVARCRERFGAIDVLQNNVGILEVGGPVEASEESWERVMKVNIGAMFRSWSSRAAAPSSTSPRSRRSAGSACPTSPTPPARGRWSPSPARSPWNTPARGSGPIPCCPG
jgi:NAD(P)-dependent dehydrogenase (short-subunit alcohol dehydrogenase family)